MGAPTIPVWRPPITGAGTLNGQRPLSEQLETVAAASTAIPIAYGEVMIGGRIFAATYTGGTWYVGALFCLGEIDSYVNLYLNDAAPVAGVTVTYYTGTTTQTADATLAAQISGYADTLVVSTPQGSVGVAYVVIAYTDAHYSGFPTIKARIKGRKVGGISENRLTYSEQFDHANWSKTECTITANAIAAPDGNTTADKFCETNTASTSHRLLQTAALTALADHTVVTISVFAKYVERDLRIALLDRSNTTNFANFTLSTGEVGNTGGAQFVGASIADFGGGWYRCSITASVGTGGTTAAVRLFLMNGSTLTYTGTTGYGCYIWGAQCEVKASPGVYTVTTSAATAPAYSENPALCLRDLILSGAIGLGEDVDDLSAAWAVAECDALVIAEQRRRLALVLDAVRDADEWIATLSTYAGCWTTKRGTRWVMTPDRPATVWNFNGSAESWTVAGATLDTSSGTHASVASTGASPEFKSPSGLTICGNQRLIVRARVRRTAGSAWAGKLEYVTSFHGFSSSFQCDPDVASLTNNVWTVVQWDLGHQTAGGADWLQSIVTRIQIKPCFAASNTFDFDWISVGVIPVTTADVLADSVQVLVADTLQAPTVVRVAYTDTSVTPWRTKHAEAVLTGVSTGTVARRESQVSLPGVRFYSQAWREAAERLLKLQRLTQVELVLFDEGLGVALGDVLSVLHPYTNTASSAELDTATLFRVIAEPEVISHGRVRVPAVAYSATDYDNTEPTVTWGAAPTLLGALDVGRSGDGINRVPPRFCGGFGAPDYDGQFPVSKGADVDFCGVSYGDGSTGPTAGYYGAHALKIDTAAGTSARTVWFGSSSTDYNIPLDPSSKWLFSCKYWPLANNTAIDANLKSSAGTLYTLTDSTNTGLAWNDFVHTATGQNLLDLSADASDKGILRLDVKASNTSVWFDGIMLEKKVANGAVVSPWRPSPVSSRNGPRSSPRQISPGMLDTSVQIDDGAGARSIAKGVISGVCMDGTAVTFAQAYADVPVVIFQPGALTNYNAYATDFALVCEARSLSATGFTPYLKIRQTVGTITTYTDNTVVDEGSSATPRYTIHKTQSAQAWDDRYTFQFDATIKNIPDFEPGYAGYLPGELVVGIYVALSSGVWTQVASVRVYGDGGVSATTTRSNVQHTVTVDGLGQHAGKEFGIKLLSELVSGGSINFDSVVYGTAGAPTETSATAGGVAGVPYVVLAP